MKKKLVDHLERSLADQIGADGFADIDLFIEVIGDLANLYGLYENRDTNGLTPAAFIEEAEAIREKLSKAVGGQAVELLEALREAYERAHLSLNQEELIQ